MVQASDSEEEDGMVIGVNSEEGKASPSRVEPPSDSDTMGEIGEEDDEGEEEVGRAPKRARTAWDTDEEEGGEGDGGESGDGSDDGGNFVGGGAARYHKTTRNEKVEGEESSSSEGETEGEEEEEREEGEAGSSGKTTPTGQGKGTGMHA